MTARLAEQAGFDLVYLTGYGLSTSLYGLPDLGLLTMTEMIDACRRMCEAVNIPLIADCDTGYGGPANVWRAVRGFEDAGTSAVQLEDQVFPKRCGHLADKKLVSTEEMVRKIVAATDARRDDALVIIARTDAVAVEGLDHALSRAEAYRAAGADVTFIEALTSKAEIALVAQEAPRPLLFDWSFDGVTPHVSRRWLAEIGYSLVLFPDTGFAVHRGLRRFLSKLHATDSLDELADDLATFDEINSFARIQDWLSLDSRTGLTAPN